VISAISAGNKTTGASRKIKLNAVGDALNFLNKMINDGMENKPEGEINDKNVRDIHVSVNQVVEHHVEQG
jgi:hypothetical protein